MEAFFSFWVKWAGKPLKVSIDLETGLGSRSFGLALGGAGVTIVPIAGQAQAHHMMTRTARNRTRPWHEPQIGDKCFFYREFRKKGVSGLVKAWHGPALVVGIQGQSNLWLVFGGRAYLVAQEHCREAVGEEAFYGKPEVQEALTLFKGMKTTREEYEDLTKQGGPMDDSLDQPVEEDDESDTDMGNPETHPNPSRVEMLPEHLKPLCASTGWKHDSVGNPVFVAYKSYALRTPVPKYDSKTFPYRTSWAFISGRWRLLENEVKWIDLEDVNDVVPGGPADILVTVFTGRTRKQVCLDDLPVGFKKQKVDGADVFLAVSRKQQKALDKDVPYNKIKPEERAAHDEAESKEWDSWLKYDAVEPLSIEESERILETKRERVLKCRFVYRNKSIGLKDPQGNPLPLRAKARLCVQGQNDPDCLTGAVKLDAPTIQHCSFMTFLHSVVSFGWTLNFRNGDISSAFLEGDLSQGEPLYMFMPERGLPNLSKEQILKLKRPVNGRPDAPRAWYNQISRFIMEEMQYERSILDPALFILRDKNSNPKAMLILRVDDLLVATDGTPEAESTVKLLYDRFPFGEWGFVHEGSGISYCGKEVVVGDENGEKVIFMPQKGFVEGRLETISLSSDRKKQLDEKVTPEEQSDFRSVVGSLQWLATQSRPDVCFGVN